jgi:hypothetical protein
MRKQSGRLLLGFLGSGVLLVIFLAGCGVTSTGVGGSVPETPSSPLASPSKVSSTPVGIPSSGLQLACVLEGVVHPVDTMSETLHCTVTHAADSETAFVLHFTVTDNVGSRTLSPACRGSLSGGSGSCSITYSLIVPLIPGRSTVSGETLPNQYPLGPVVPTEVAGTPSGPPVLPYNTPTLQPQPIG